MLRGDFNSEVSYWDSLNHRVLSHVHEVLLKQNYLLLSHGCALPSPDPSRASCTRQPLLSLTISCHQLLCGIPSREYFPRHLISSAPLPIDDVLSVAFAASFCTSVSHEVHELEGTACLVLRNSSPPWRQIMMLGWKRLAADRVCG